MRRRHFPPDRNVVPAHLTLFHALPGAEAPAIRAHLAAICRQQRRFTLRSTKLRSLGRGVAIAFASPELVGLRGTLQREWRDWLTPQDLAPSAPHVTIQNKADPADARALLRDLEATLPPIVATAEGLLLWSYLGGPWALDRQVRFAG